MKITSVAPVTKSFKINPWLLVNKTWKSIPKNVTSKVIVQQNSGHCCTPMSRACKIVFQGAPIRLYIITLALKFSSAFHIFLFHVFAHNIFIYRKLVFAQSNLVLTLNPSNLKLPTTIELPLLSSSQICFIDGLANIRSRQKMAKIKSGRT